jgi:hypothetical protein
MSEVTVRGSIHGRAKQRSLATAKLTVHRAATELSPLSAAQTQSAHGVPPEGLFGT